MAFPLLIITCFIFKNSLRPKLHLADSNYCRSHPDNKISNHIEYQVPVYIEISKHILYMSVCTYIVILRIWFLKYNCKQDHISTFIYWEVVPFGVHSKGKFFSCKKSLFLKMSTLCSETECSLPKMFAWRWSCLTQERNVSQQMLLNTFNDDN